MNNTEKMAEVIAILIKVGKEQSELNTSIFRMLKNQDKRIDQLITILKKRK